MASIAHIPNEILAIILRNLDTHDLHSARTVSIRWMDLIDEFIGQTVNVGSPNEFTNLAIWEDVDIVEDIGIRECNVGTLIDTFGPPFKFPQVVRSLSFEGPLNPTSFVTLVAPLPALQHLSLHYSALEDIELIDGMIETRLLQTLKITSHCISPSRDRQGAVRFTRNVVTFLKNVNSRRLTQCILDLPFLPEFELELTTSVFHLVGSHHKSLEILQVYFGITFRLEGTETVSVLYTGNQWESVTFGLRAGIGLRRICFAGPNQSTQNHLWTRFFGSQNRLKELFYMNDSPNISHGLGVISQNSSTLTKILFHINALDDARKTLELDCGVFSTCHSLTHLLIRGRPAVIRVINNNDNEDDQQNAVFGTQFWYPKIANLTALPKQIRLLSFRDIHLTTVDVDEIVGLPRLKRLRLVDTGCYGDMGICSEQLLGIFKKRSYEEVELINSFNRFVLKSSTCLLFMDELLIKHVVRNNWSLHLVRDRDEDEFVSAEGSMFQYDKLDQNLRANDVCDVVFK